MKMCIILFTLFFILISCSTNSKFMKQDNSKLTIEQIGTELAKSFGISEEEAKYLATEYSKRKWRDDPFFKVLKCEKLKSSWYVISFADDGLTGWGSKVWISKKGNILKDEFIPGL